MRWLITVLVFISACNISETKKIQPPVCQCPASIHDSNAKPATIFSFSNGKAIALWERNNQKDSFPGSLTYSDFIISECDTDFPAGSWNDRTHCTVEMAADTLVIRQLSLIALSPKLDMVHMPWLITKFYYRNNKLESEKEFNPELHYSEKQIKRAFEHLDTTKWRTHNELGNSREAFRLMRFASQMMVASISGSSKAEVYFYKVKEQFQPEGEYALWFKEMEEIIYFSRNNRELQKF
jgi:hypothetical protein